MALSVQVIVSAIDRMTGPLGKMEKGASQWQARVSGMGIGMTAAGGAILGGLGAMIAQTTALGDELDKMMRMTGLSADALTTLGFAAEQSGSSMAALQGALRFVAKNAYGGSDSATAAFEKLGIKVRDSGGHLKAADRLLVEAAGGMSKFADESEKSGVAMAIFGRGGQAILPLLREGPAGIRALQEEARKLGIAWSDEGVAKANAYKDSLDKMQGAFGGLKRTIASELLPTLTGWTEGMAKTIGGYQSWRGEHEALNTVLVTSFGVGGTVLTGLGMIGIALPRIAEGWRLVASAAKLAATWQGIATFGMGGIVVGEMAAIGYYGPTGPLARAKGAAKGRAEVAEHAARGERAVRGQSKWEAATKGVQWEPIPPGERDAFYRKLKEQGYTIKRQADISNSILERSGFGGGGYPSLTSQQRSSYGQWGAYYAGQWQQAMGELAGMPGVTGGPEFWNAQQKMLAANRQYVQVQLVLKGDELRKIMDTRIKQVMDRAAE